MWGDRRVKPLCWLFKHSAHGEHIYRSRFSDQPISHDPSVSTFFKSVGSYNNVWSYDDELSDFYAKIDMGKARTWNHVPLAPMPNAVKKPAQNADLVSGRRLAGVY